MTDQELMQMALDALFMFVEYDYQGNPLGGAHFNGHKAIEALRARLAQPKREPVAWKDAPSKIYLQVCEESNCDQPFDSHIEISWCQDKINNSDISYVRADIAPPQREWQGLTDKDWIIGKRSADYIAGAEWAEAKLKEKNNG